MSIILDALRKSEAARRRSETPDLFSTMPATAAPPSTPRRKPVLAIAVAASLAAMLLAGTAWWWMRQDATPELAVADSRGNAAEQATDPAVQRDVSVQTGDPAAQIPAPTSLPPNAPLSSMPTSSVPMSNAPAPNATVPNAAAAATPPTAAIPTPHAAPPPATSNAAPSTSTNPLATTTPPSLPSPPAAVRNPSQTAAQSAAASSSLPPPAGNGPLRVADLDPASRRQLPPLKLSMHLWNEAPAQRFVILDGQRLREGDLLGEIVVERIDREGAILIWRGERIRIDVR